MAVELIRQVWCDIDLKKNKTKVDGREMVATVVHEGKYIKIDLCPGCEEKLTFAEIIAYGDVTEPPHADPRRQGVKIRGTRRTSPPDTDKSELKSVQGGLRTLVECSRCGKQVTSGSGWGLHNNAHIRKGENDAEPIPVVP